MTPAADRGAALLEVCGLTTRFPLRGAFPGGGRGVVYAAEEVSFTIGRGRIVGLVGESGSGKSTVGRTLLRLETATSGQVRFEGENVLAFGRRDLARYRRRVQAIFQDPAASLDPRMRVGDIIAEPLAIHRIGDARQRRARAAELAAQVGLTADSLNRTPRAFSGGQRQRIGIARALAIGPDLIIADEPVSALDVSVQAQIINLLARLQAELGLALLFISHDLPTVEFLCDSVVVMYLGRVMEIAPAAEFQRSPAHPYSRMLVSQVPRFGGPLGAGGGAASAADGGETPSPLAPPSGCVFRTRCPEATGECAAVVPTLKAIGPGRQVACLREAAV